MLHRHILAVWIAFFLTASAIAADSSSPRNAVVAGDRVFFLATARDGSGQLWTTDGTGAGTALVRELPKDTSMGHLVACGSRVAFWTIEGERASLWGSDGTAAGTVILADLGPANVRWIVGTGSLAMVLTAHATPQLLSTDGTPEGTRTVHVFDEADPFSWRRVVAGGAVYFSAGASRGGRGVWRSDGTAAGTKRVYDSGQKELPALVTGAGGRGLFHDSGLWAAGENASEFLAPMPAVWHAGTSGEIAWVVAKDAVWRTDGTAAGTRRIATAALDGANLQPIIATPSKVFIPYSCDGYWTSELCVRTYTEAGEETDLRSFRMYGAALLLNDRLLFGGRTAAGHEIELWTSDGTEGGTRLLRDIATASDGATPSSRPAPLVVFRGVMLFSAEDPDHGRELWRSDGTAEGTWLVADLRPDARLEGTVHDAVTGRPLGGVPILYGHPASSPPSRVRSAPDGTWVSEGLAPGIYLVRTENEAGYVDERTTVEVTVGQTVSGIAFRLAPGSRIRGRIFTRGTGAPVPNATIDVLDASGARVTRATSDASGAYVTPAGLVAGDYALRVSEPLAHAAPSGNTPVRIVAGRDANGIDIGLDPLGRIAGTVRDAESGAAVRATIRIFDRKRGERYEVVTDESGAFDIALPAGEYRLIADAGRFWVTVVWPGVPCTSYEPLVCWFEPGAQSVIVTDATRVTADFGLSRPVAKAPAITGRVIDAQTGTGTGFWYSLIAQNETSVHFADIRPDGAYQFFTLKAPGRYVVSLYLSKYVVTSWPAAGCGGPCDGTRGVIVNVPSANDVVSGVDFVVDRGAKITGVAKFAGKAQTNAYYFMFFDESGKRVPSYSDSTEGLPPGKYFAVWDSNGGTPYERQVYGRPDCPTCDFREGTPIVVGLRDEVTIEIDLRLRPAVRGRVVDARTRSPIPNALVTLTDVNGTVTTAATDAKGEYIAAPRQTSARVAVSAAAPGYARQVHRGIECLRCNDPSEPIVPTAGTPATVDFALARLADVSGRVTDVRTGEPLANVRMQVLNERGEVTGGGTTDAAGRYAISDAVGASRYFVVATDARPSVRQQYWRNVDCSPRCAQRPADATPISAGDGTPIAGIDFALRTAEAPVSFLVTDGAVPVAGVGIELWSSSGQLVHRSTNVSGADGVLRFDAPIGAFFARTWNRSGWVDGLLGGRPCGRGCVLGGELLTVIGQPGTAAPTLQPITVHRIAVNDVFPARGTTAGGETITIRGGGYLPGTRVEIGGVDATILTIDEETITAVAPPRSTAGDVDLIVIRPDGLRAARHYTYAAPCAPPLIIPRTVVWDGGWKLGVEIHPDRDTNVSWHRGGRGGDPIVLLNGTEIVVSSADADREHTARVTWPCGQREISVLEGGRARRRAAR